MNWRLGNEQQEEVLAFLRKTPMQDFKAVELHKAMVAEGSQITMMQVKYALYELREKYHRITLRKEGRHLRFTLSEALANAHNMPMLKHEH